MSEERPSQPRPPGPSYSESDGMVIFGRLMGIAIIIIAISVGFKAASDLDDDQAWVFFASTMTPLGIGFLILVATEIVNRLPNR